MKIEIKLTDETEYGSKTIVFNYPEDPGIIELIQDFTNVLKTIGYSTEIIADYIDVDWE